MTVQRSRGFKAVFQALCWMLCCLKATGTNPPPMVPIVQASDTVSCFVGDSVTLSIANPDTVDIIPEGLGPANLSIGSYSSFPATNQFLNFYVNRNSVKIKSVDVFFSGIVGSSFTIIIRNATTLQTVFTLPGTVAVSSAVTPQKINLNTTLDSGNYQIGLSVNPGTYRNSSGGVYPYSAPSGGISITGHTFTTGPASYYFFYNWQVDVPHPAHSVYTWVPGNLTGRSVNVAPNATTTYTVTSTKPSGLSASNTFKLWYLPIPKPEIIAGGPTTFCKGGGVLLDAGSGYSSYSWFDGVQVVGNSRTFFASPQSPVNYYLTVSTGGPCTAGDTISINVLSQSQPSITPGDTAFCDGGNVTLDAGSGYSIYEWKKGNVVVGNSQNLIVNSSGTYTVTVTNTCSASKSALIVVNPNPPPATITASGPTTLCTNGSNPQVTLSADTTGTGNDGSILWNEAFSATGNSYRVLVDDINLQLYNNTYPFSVTVTNKFGCVNGSDSLEVSAVHCPSTITIKAFLEGYYLSGSVMQPVLYNQGVMNATGNETDTLLLELRDVNDPSLKVTNATAMLMTNGLASTAFAVTPGNYWVVIKHRNSIETWSAAPVTLPSALYDFSNSQTKAYGDNLKDPYNEGIWSLFSADNNQDGFIDIFDFPEYDIKNQAFTTYEYSSSDYNGDGFVDIFDFTYYDNNNQGFVIAIQP